MPKFVAAFTAILPPRSCLTSCNVSHLTLLLSPALPLDGGGVPDRLTRSREQEEQEEEEEEEEKDEEEQGWSPPRRRRRRGRPRGGPEFFHKRHVCIDNPPRA